MLTFSAAGLEPCCHDGGRSASAVPQAFGVEARVTSIVVSLESVLQSNHDLEVDAPLIATWLMYLWPSGAW